MGGGSSTQSKYDGRAEFIASGGGIPGALRQPLQRQPSNGLAALARGAFNAGGLFGTIGDNYRSLEAVTAALQEAGIESSNLILGVDFTKVT